MKTFKLSLLTAAMSVALVACGGGGGGGGNNTPDPVDPPVTPPADAVQVAIDSAARPADDRLPCAQAANDATCDLRIYQVMVESFIDGDANYDYNTGYGNSHHKGDIQGIINALPYIESLGMNAIWLTPVFQSNTSDARLNATGYFAGDYFSVDTKFGTKAQLQQLVEEAHARGLYVFLDGVFGHHSGNVTPSPMGAIPTNNVQQGSGYEAKYPDDLDFYTEVATYWIKELKIDGWRLDQAYQVPVEHWTTLREAVEAASAEVTYTNKAGETVNPLGYMVGEIWKSAGEIASQGYGSNVNPALYSNFDFPVRYSVVQTFAGDEGGSGNRAATNLDAGLMNHLSYPEHARPNLMLGNHDLLRFGDLLQRADLADPVDAEYWARHKAAMSFLAAFSGPITMYYNEEIGAQVDNFADKVDNNVCADQGKCDDHVARSSARIEGIATRVGGDVVELTAEEADLKDYVAQLMQVRAANPALSSGSRTHIYSDNYLFIDRKDAGDNHVLYVVNTKDVEAEVTLSGAAIGSDAELVSLLDNNDLQIAGGEYSFTLPAFGAAIYEIASPTAEGPSFGGEGGLVGTGPLADCSAADVAEIGPLGKDMYIRGTYNGGDNFGATPDTRKFGYKGDAIYQVVVSETAQTSYTFKFADVDWTSEFAVADSAPVQIASEQGMAIAAGPGTESNVYIPEAGDYVFSFRINAELNGGEMMVSKCE